MLYRATPNDHPAIANLAAEVYGELGDYGTILPSWLVHPGVEVYIDRVSSSGSDEGSMRAFVLLGFFEPLAVQEPQLLIDLLAIAVAPKEQRKGHGRRILREAIALATKAAEGFARADLRLTVSETNPIAQRLFSSEGFEILDPNHGAYHRGQQAIRMNRSLTPA